MNIKIAACGAVLALSAASGFAADPFIAVASTTDVGTPLTLTSSSGEFFDFKTSVFQNQGPFQQLSGRNYTGNMTFLGVRNAILFSSSGNGTAVNLSLPPIAFNRTFTGPTKAAVDDAIDAFFKKDGAQTIADFLKAIAKTSPIAVTDGNPASATALAASGMFSSLGYTSSDELVDGLDSAGTTTTSQSRFGGISLGINAGKFEAGAFKGTMYDLTGTILNFGGDTVRFVVPFGLNYLKLDAGSKVGGAGLTFSLPVRYKRMSKDSDINWRITPLFGLSVRGSKDLASLSPLWTAGVVNTVDYRLSPQYVVSMVNQFTFHKSIKVSFSDLDFDPNINQQILKNGFRLTTPFTRRVIGDCFVVYTNFLKDAAVKNFWSLGGSVAFRVTQRWNLVLGVNYDTGSNFKSYAGGLSSAWKW